MLMFEKSIRALSLGVVAVLPANGAHTQSSTVDLELSAHQFAARNTSMTVIPTSSMSEDPSQGQALGLLNRWLTKHADQKVVGLSSVLAYRDGAQAYVISTVPGNSKKQHIGYFPNPLKTQEDSKSRKSFGVDALTQWLTQNPNKELVTFTSVPRYSGGVDGWMICTEDKQ